MFQVPLFPAVYLECPPSYLFAILNVIPPLDLLNINPTIQSSSLLFSPCLGSALVQVVYVKCTPSLLFSPWGLIVRSAHNINTPQNSRSRAPLMCILSML